LVNENFIITKDKDKTLGLIRFTVKGRVNSNNAPALQYKIEDALNYGELNIILNMEQVEYLSSDGIRVILKIYKQAEKAGGKFKIERPSEIVRNVLGLVALNELLV